MLNKFKKSFAILGVLALAFAFVIPMTTNAQEVIDSGTTTETFTGIDASSENVLLDIDSDNNYDNYYNYSVEDGSGTAMVDSTDYFQQDEDVVVSMGWSGSEVSVTYNYEVFASTDFSGSAQTLMTNTIQDVGSTIFSVLGPILGLAGVLIALFFGFKQLRKWVGGSRS